MRQQAIIRIVVLTGMLGGSASAQQQANMPGQARPVPLPMPAAPAPTSGFRVGVLAIEPFEMGDPVENAPYSAEIVNEVAQDLPDGNRIERRTTGTVARDGRGRVRREHQLAAIGPVVPEGEARMVTISDPVAGIHYSLDPVRKVAMRSRPPRVRAEIHARPDAVFTFKRGGPEVTLGVASEPEASEIRTEQLGTKEYEGVGAEGTMTIVTLPAGAIGNLRPIEIVSERWYSPELRVVVYTRRADPRFGETTYRLTNITRAEPDPSLFEAPAEYKREDVKPFRVEPPTDAMFVKPLFEKPLP